MIDRKDVSFKRIYKRFSKGIHLLAALISILSSVLGIRQAYQLPYFHSVEAVDAQDSVEAGLLKLKWIINPR